MNKTILITGASAGFGTACARRYAGGNNRLILAARRLDRLKALQEELQGTECHVLELDVRDRNKVKSGLAGLPSSFQEKSP